MEGQIFLSPLPADFGDGLPRVNVPTGQWKDGLFDVFNAGFFHPSLWCGFCFTQGKLYYNSCNTYLVSTLLSTFVALLSLR